MMEDVIHAAILGLVEGITEFLPISSTGHLLIAENLLNCPQSDAFNVLIQIGPMAAAALVFRKHIAGLVTGFRDRAARDEVVKLTACVILTCLGGVAAKALGLELPETVLPVALATLIGGGVIFLVERHARHAGGEPSSVVTWPVAIAVAAGQLLAAIFPGTSRSGAAVMAALCCGMARPAAVRFAFLAGIPVMLAAGALQLKVLADAGQGASLTTPPTLTALAVATVTAWLAVVWLLRYVRRHTFEPFAWYRFGLGIVLLALMALGRMR
jgi:undecaprenyl-diphosphatase